MGGSNKLFQTLPPAPVVEYITPAPAVSAAPAPVDEYVAPAPAVFAAPSPVVRSAGARCGVYRTFSPNTVFLSHQRLQMQRHTYRLSLAPRVERASRLRQVLCRDAVLWTRPGTCLGAGHACFRGAFGVRVETHEKERETDGGDFAASQS